MYAAWNASGTVPLDSDLLNSAVRNGAVMSAILAFWLSTGYNFGCVIASDTLFDSRGRFSGSSYPMNT